VVAGAAAYQKYCALCHGADARGYAADNAPSLVSPTFLESVSDVFLTRSIREGRQGTAMAGYARQFGGPLDDRQVGEIIAYLRSQGPAPLRLPPHRSSGDATRGQEVYDRTCVPCHGTRAQRGFAVQLWHPNFLAVASDEFLHHAITLGRPGTAMPSFIGTLSAGEIDDLLALLKSWGGAPPTRPTIQHPEIPKGPVVINPGGATPKFTLREDRYVPAEQVKKALDAKNRLVIIDARATSDWHQARIPGAISVPYYGFSRLDDVPNDDRTWVLAYCACPHHASGVVVDELRRRGYKHTAIIDEGILEWQRRKYPVEGNPAPPASAPGAASLGVPLRLAPIAPPR
jgi:cytochrome c oxidase cbb3-type subunit 3/ubiquinol-cytochrome c reductase cytochrome c subunit